MNSAYFIEVGPFSLSQIFFVTLLALAGILMKMKVEFINKGKSWTWLWKGSSSLCRLKGAQGSKYKWIRRIRSGAKGGTFHLHFFGLNHNALKKYYHILCIMCTLCLIQRFLVPGTTHTERKIMIINAAPGTSYNIVQSTIPKKFIRRQRRASTM